ncbi:hybrid sensor histidine kinase/response regulator [Massilia yuzhufengensis]|uniref:histidine kinase n=1 Tax=Massilia yuzhufengensis TaxID=1164594 RepID=A0A1I1W6Q3_9BURK|nr:ATP-binding protein [Massilia yuzhufengensis]SFD89053.1 PAS domain S-box-containing protein [Massilia yuzhufengensis]
MAGALLDADALYDQAPCALLVADADGLLLRANATACSWLGFSPPELVGKVRIQELMTVGARLFHHTHCQPVLQVRGSVAELQIDLRHRDGTRLPMLVNIVRRRDGALVRDQWALFMATERQSYERELRNARKAAEEALEARRGAESQLQAVNAALSAADRRKDEFLATLSHELRNPLAPMRSALEVLRLTVGAEGANPRLLSVFDRQLHHLTHLVDDLMEVSRITQDKMELRREALDLAALARAAVLDTAGLMDHARHHLQLDLPPLPVTVDADPTRISQVLVNLLTNAAKYTPDGGRIVLSLTCEDGEAVLAVVDNGIGLPAHALATVFDMFSQLEPALERSRGGLGIGLALVRGIVELHGGAIEAHSEGEGRGSCFRVRLPLAQAVAAPAPVLASMPAPSRILVVDDNADAAEMLLMALELFGCEVRTAHSATAALAMVADFAPEVALLDIGLPDLNGYELARRLRAMEGGRSMRLIAATGWGQEKDRQRAFDAGFDHHLTKPIDFERLRSVLAPQAPADHG